MVRPQLVYVSDSTELGTIYTHAELAALREFCSARGLYLYLDGARLGSALAAEGNDLSLAGIAALTDAFYIGGTKNGALLGEALVIVNPALQGDFRYLIKQRGAMLAKGSVLGAQFEALFEDGLFFELAAHANRMAQRLGAAIVQAGFALASDAPGNQVFPVLPDTLVAELRKRCEFEVWQRLPDATTVIRLVASWATREQAVDTFIEEFAELTAQAATARRD
jgi:threonine aldolase